MASRRLEGFRALRAIGFLIAIFIFTASSLAQTEGASPEFSSNRPQMIPNKASWEAMVIRQGQQIESLEVVSNRLPVVLIERNGVFRPLVEVRLKVNRPGLQVRTANGRLLRSGAQPGEFLAIVYLNSRLNELNVKVVPTGDSKSESGGGEVERILIFAPQAQEFKVVSNWDQVSASAGIADVAYDQSTYGKFTTQAILLSARYTPNEFKRKFGVMGKVDFTFFNINPSPEQANPNIVVLDPDLTYRLEQLEKPNWRVWLTGGLSYRHMLTQEKSFGISHLAAPAFGARAQFFEGENDSYHLIFRYTPLAEQQSFANLIGQRGLVLGFRADRILPDQKRLESSFEILHDSYRTSTGTSITLRMISFRLGMSL